MLIEMKKYNLKFTCDLDTERKLNYLVDTLGSKRSQVIRDAIRLYYEVITCLQYCGVIKEK